MRNVDTGNNNLIYFNEAADAWPKAPGVAEAVFKAINAVAVSPGRGAGKVDETIGQCRQGLAALVGGSSGNRVVFAANSTMALNVAVLGADCKRGDLVITSVAEHNSVLRPLYHLQRRTGIELEIIRLGDDGEYDDRQFAELLNRKPKLVVLNHASNVTGRVFHVSRLFAAAREAGALTVLDVSQSLGCVPVDAVELNADVVAFTGHKGLRGPAGIGGLYVADSVELTPVIVGGTGIRSELLYQPEEMPIRLEAGTPNYPAIAGLLAALEWREKEGDEFDARQGALGERLRAEITGIAGLEVYDRLPADMRLPIVSFNVPGWDVADVAFALENSFGVHCRSGLHCAPLMHRALGAPETGSLRFSISGNNSEEQIDRALDALGSFIS